MKKTITQCIISMLLFSYSIGQTSKLEVWKDTTIHDSTRLKALYDFAWILMINNPDSARSLAQSLQSHSILSKSKLYEAKSLLLIGMAFSENCNYTESEKALRKSINISNLIKDKSNESLAYCNLALLFFRNGDISRAFDYNITSLKLAKEAKDYLALTWAHNSLACIYQDRNEIINARLNYFKALEFAKLAKDTSKMAIAIGNIGTLFDFNDIRQAECFEQSLVWSKSINNKKMEGYILRSIGERFNFLKQYDSAVYYFNLSLIKAIEMKDEYQESLSYGYIGNTYFLAGKYNQAIVDLNKCLMVNEKVNDIDIYSQVYNYLYKSYKAIGKTDSALFAYEKYMFYEDSLSNEGLIKLMEKKENELRFKEEKEKIKSDQDIKNSISQQQIQKQKIIRNSFIAGSLLLIILIVVLINRNKLKRSIEMEKMRSRLSRDLHDDIGSTLSSINILSRTAQSNLQNYSNVKTKESLEKINERSQRLLDSMGDIIWNINPGNDTIEEVVNRMREYATTILEAKNIDYTFNFPNENMEFQLSMEVKNNMYLIFKEAVNNLSKYSSANKANLSLTFNEKFIHLKIEDNGKGFNIDEVNHRGGLNNMQHRAEEIKGKIKISAVIGKGTEIELILSRYF